MGLRSTFSWISSGSIRSERRRWLMFKGRSVKSLCSTCEPHVLTTISESASTAAPHLFTCRCVPVVVSVLAQDGTSTATVLGLRHCFQMVGIAAQRNTTEMVDLQSFRDRSNEPLVCESMNRKRLATDTCVAVTLGGSAFPHPTVVGGNRAATHQCFSRKFGAHGSQYIREVF